MNVATNNLTDIFINQSMEANQTHYEYWTQPSWLIPVAINGILIAATLWIVFSLIYYGKKTGKWGSIGLKNSDKLHSGWVYSSVVACAVTALMRLITSQIAFNIGFNDPDTCERVCDLLYVEYALVLFTTYIFLWLRQRVFYTNRMLNIDTTRLLRCLSAASLTILLMAGIGVVLVNTISIAYSSTSAGCIYRIKDNLEYETYAWVASAIILVIGQVMLVVLLIYPLQKNTGSDDTCNYCHCCYISAETKLQDDVFESSSNSIQFNSRTNSTIHSISHYSNRWNSQRSPDVALSSRHRHGSNVHSSGSVRRIMQRTIIFGSISLTTDLILIIALSTTLLDTSSASGRRISVLIYDLNSFLNLMLVILSCIIYKKILTSLCSHKNVDIYAGNKSSTSMSIM